MAGVGKIMKQAAKMQKQMEQIQAELSEKKLEVTSGGSAVRIVISGNGEFKSLTLDSEFLKEDKAFVEETLLTAIQESVQKAREYSESEMQKVTGSLSIPGLF